MPSRGANPSMVLAQFRDFLNDLAAREEREIASLLAVRNRVLAGTISPDDVRHLLDADDAKRRARLRTWSHLKRSARREQGSARATVFRRSRASRGRRVAQARRRSTKIRSCGTDPPGPPGVIGDLSGPDTRERNRARQPYTLGRERQPGVIAYARSLTLDRRGLR
jgi:hypothetical protein